MVWKQWFIVLAIPYTGEATGYLMFRWISRNHWSVRRPYSATPSGLAFPHRKRSLLEVFLSLGLHQSSLEDEDSPELLQACTSCNDNISLWIFWCRRMVTFTFWRFPSSILRFLKHLSTFLQKFAVCLKLQFVYTSLFFEQISSTHKLHTEIAHRNCTLHVGRHKIFTAPCQVTADFLPCWLV